MTLSVSKEEHGCAPICTLPMRYLPGGHENFAAAERAGIERLLKGDGVLVRAIADRAKVADVENRRWRMGNALASAEEKSGQGQEGD